MQRALWHESFEDALGTVVAALGGAKKVGAMLWPEKPVEDAGRLLKHCLNGERAEKLSTEQIVWLLRQARENDIHDAINFLCRQVGYEAPKPIPLEDERMQVQREFNQRMRDLMDLAARMEETGFLRAVK